MLERVTPEPNTGCLLWVGGADYDGYGIASVRGVSHRVHRLAWERVNGPVPPGMEVLHHCDMPGCVLADPDPRRSHLFLGTNLDNIRDMEAKSRRKAAAGDAHYSRKHPELRPRGERHGRRKLTEDQAREALERLARGEQQCDIATGFGVSRSAINMIALGRRWTHLRRPAA